MHLLDATALLNRSEPPSGIAGAAAFARSLRLRVDGAQALLWHSLAAVRALDRVAPWLRVPSCSRVRKKALLQMGLTEQTQRRVGGGVRGGEGGACRAHPCSIQELVKERGTRRKWGGARARGWEHA
ncbi:hypothetical protein ZWY2020_053239 [Hordeum vulgare]|nr:hypothetical protein ZWY2020_053239 [Hordeum vulgare]